MGNYCCAESQSSTPIVSQATSNYYSKEGGLSGSSAGNWKISVSGSVDEVKIDGEILPTPNMREFSFAELKSATRNFKADITLGEGDFGIVYKGWIDEKSSSKCSSGCVVAVKKLNSESMQGFEEWQAEVNFLGRLLHPNLVKLLGFCWEDKELLLIYEFMQKGSLENHLFRRGGAVHPLSWNLRLKIVLGAARGLAFLHSSEKQIIYRDFKASNILLDGNYNAKLSDFGLAKNGPAGDASHVTTRVMGTYGYAAPEYVATGHLYVKSDVYGFGVVLLEMLTGLRALDTKRPDGQHNLVTWLKPSLSDRRKLMRVMDPRLENQFPTKAAIQAAKLTIKCLGYEPRVRPSMIEVVKSLEQIMPKEQIKAIKNNSKEIRSNTRHTTWHYISQQPHDYLRSQVSRTHDLVSCVDPSIIRANFSSHRESGSLPPVPPPAVLPPAGHLGAWDVGFSFIDDPSSGAKASGNSVLGPIPSSDKPPRHPGPNHLAIEE